MIRNIIFDFDGVILDSMPIRDFGFEEIFKEFDKDKVMQFLKYHRYNGGISRYIKIRYFYEKFLGQEISHEKVQKLANKFSDIMKKELTNKKYLIEQSIDFLRNYSANYNLHIASGSDQIELRYLCDKLEIAQYFISIHGSPIDKNDLVKEILEINKYKIDETILIGDSINDYQAANVNGIVFYGFNNKDLKDVSKVYLDDYGVLI